MKFSPAQIPDNWFSRVTPYTIQEVGGEIRDQYFAHPVEFGGNTGNPNSFVGIGTRGPYFQNSRFTGTPQGVVCLLYQFATENDPSAVQGQVPTASLLWAATKLNPIFRNFGCPLRINPA